MPVLLKLKGELNKRALEESLETIIYQEVVEMTL